MGRRKYELQLEGMGVSGQYMLEGLKKYVLLFRRAL
jgi:hypothetical protein